MAILIGEPTTVWQEDSLPSAMQGVAVEGSYYYVSMTDELRKYRRSDDVLEWEVDVSADHPGDVSQCNGAHIRDGKIYLGMLGDEYQGIMIRDASDGSFIRNIQISGLMGPEDDVENCEGGAFRPGTDRFFCVCRHSTLDGDGNRVHVYREMDFSDEENPVWVDDHKYNEGGVVADPGSGQGVVWVTADDGTQYITTCTHNVSTPESNKVIIINRWTGSGLEFVSWRRHVVYDFNGSHVAGQGHHLSPDGTEMWWTGRINQVNQGFVIRTSIEVMRPDENAFPNAVNSVFGDDLKVWLRLDEDSVDPNNLLAWSSDVTEWTQDDIASVTDLGGGEFEVVEASTTGGGPHRVRSPEGIDLGGTGDVYTASVWVQRGAGSRNVSLNFRGDSIVVSRVNVDLGDGSVLGTTEDRATVSGVSVDAEDGGWRISWVNTLTSDDAQGEGASVYVVLLDGESTVYDGDGSSSIIVKEPQVNVGSTRLAYQPTGSVPGYQLANSGDDGYTATVIQESSGPLPSPKRTPRYQSDNMGFWITSSGSDGEGTKIAIAGPSHLFVLNEPFTLACIASKDFLTGSSTRGCLFAAAAASGLRFAQFREGASGGTLGIVVRDDTEAVAIDVESTAAPFAVNEPVRVVVTFNGTGDCDIYINGILDSSHSIDVSNPVTWAEEHFGRGSVVGRYWRGHFDEPIIAKRYLSAADVSELDVAMFETATLTGGGIPDIFRGNKLRRGF